MTRRVALWTTVAVGMVSAGRSPATGGPLDQGGLWGAPFKLPLIATHAATLATGDVLHFGVGHGVPRLHGWLLEPDTLMLTEVTPPWNLILQWTRLPG